MCAKVRAFQRYQNYCQRMRRSKNIRLDQKKIAFKFHFLSHCSNETHYIYKKVKVRTCSGDSTQFYIVKTHFFGKPTNDFFPLQVCRMVPKNFEISTIEKYDVSAF